MTVYVHKLKFVELTTLFISKLLGRFVFLAGKVFADNCFPCYIKISEKKPYVARMAYFCTINETRIQ